MKKTPFLMLFVCLSFLGILVTAATLEAQGQHARIEAGRYQSARLKSARLKSARLKSARSESVRVREYLQQITASEPSLPQVKNWIDQLGDNEYSKRNAATKSLSELPRIPLDQLVEATRSTNLERASRATRILKFVLPRRRQNVNEALRVIDQFEVGGLANEVLMVVQFILDAEANDSTSKFVKDESDSGSKNLLRLARTALVKTVGPEDLPLLRFAIENESSLRRIAIFALSSKGLSSTLGVREQIDKIWNTGSPSYRLASTEALLARGDRDALERLVILLESKESNIRSLAARRLWHATGQNLEFDANSRKELRREQVDAWRAWVDEFGANSRIRTSVVFSKKWWGRTLVANYVSNAVIEYDLEGNKTWRVRVEKASGCWGLHTGERVVYGGSTLVVYASGDGPPRELWRLNERCEASPLLDGDLLVWGESGVKRFERTGRKLWEIKELVWKGKKLTPHEANMLPNGNISVVCRANPKGRKKNAALEINQLGEVVRELSCRGKPFQRLPNGNELVGIKGGRVVEIDPAGKAVWSYGLDERFVAWAQRLPNGDTLVADRFSAVDYPLRVIRPDGTTVWSKYVGHVSQAHRY